MEPQGRCQSCRVRAHPICQALEAIADVRAGRASVLRKYAKGRSLLDGNRIPETFGIVVSGVIKLLHGDKDGRQQIVGLLFPGDYLGTTQPLLAHMTAEAATAVEICCFPRRTFEMLVERNSTLEPAILEHTLLELDAVRSWMRVVLQRPAQERIACFLVMLEQRIRVPSLPRCEVLELPMSRKEMADYLGVALETVSRQLTHMKEAGAIETEGRTHIRVLDWQLLERLANTVSPESGSDQEAR